MHHQLITNSKQSHFHCSCTIPLKNMNRVIHLKLEGTNGTFLNFYVLNFSLLYNVVILEVLLLGDWFYIQMETRRKMSKNISLSTWPLLKPSYSSLIGKFMHFSNFFCMIQTKTIIWFFKVIIFFLSFKLHRTIHISNPRLYIYTLDH